jgi:hypothetical protein
MWLLCVVAVPLEGSMRAQQRLPHAPVTGHMKSWVCWIARLPGEWGGGGGSGHLMALLQWCKGLRATVRPWLLLLGREGPLLLSGDQGLMFPLQGGDVCQIQECADVVSTA